MATIIETVAQALWAAHEVWVMPVSARQHWDEMTELEKERWFKSAEIVGPGLARTLQREASLATNQQEKGK